MIPLAVDHPAMCPCGTGRSFAECCRPLHRRLRDARTAVELMRARYSAFARGDGEFLSWTWHPDTRPLPMELADDQAWLGLQVVRTERGGPADADGLVEFVAHFRAGEHLGSLHEVSRFGRLGGRWVYLNPI